MIGGFPWPDLAIVLIVGVATIKGFSRGFVRELGGLVALAAALIAPWYYTGGADAQIASFAKIATGPAHVVGMILTGILAYVIVIAAAAFLNRMAKLPILGTANALAGAIAGFFKGAIFVWVILFIALFFPLTPSIRQSLHESRLAGYVTQFDGVIEIAIANSIPTFARPYVLPLFANHRF